MWKQDCSEDGFQWIDFEDKNNSIISFARYNAAGDEHLVCVLNFTPRSHNNYPVGLPQQCRYEIIFTTDEMQFEGTEGKPETKQLLQTPPSDRLHTIPLWIYLHRKVSFFAVNNHIFTLYNTKEIPCPTLPSILTAIPFIWRLLNFPDSSLTIQKRQERNICNMSLLNSTFRLETLSF